jgi:nicotinate phosphoribosyltransferase
MVVHKLTGDPGARSQLHERASIASASCPARAPPRRQFGIPLSGTMAHSFIEAHDHELDALRNFITAREQATVLLIDTYDTERAALHVAQLSRELKTTQGRGRVQGVRIDSGDLAAEARDVRHILDTQGCEDVQIVLSGSLDEYRVQSLLGSDTPVNAFGIGTHLDVSADAPALDMAYKLEEYAGRPRSKRSPGKQTGPGTKQVWRAHDAQGRICGDLIALAGETTPGVPLLQEVMRDGQRIDNLPSLAAVREYCSSQVALLPTALRMLEEGESTYDVQVSAGIRALCSHAPSNDSVVPENTRADQSCDSSKQPPEPGPPLES